MRFACSRRMVAAVALAGALHCPGNGNASAKAFREWIRDGATAQETDGWIQYRNKKYGFCFSLPASWQGYSIVKQKWSGGPPGAQPDHHGPKLLIRHPKWTAAEPYEDIPIMIFSLSQWKLVEKEELIVSAAPFPPSEMARNAHYVFALPPRYNYDFAKGYEEVDQLVQGKRLRAPCGKDDYPLK